MKRMQRTLIPVVLMFLIAVVMISASAASNYTVTFDPNSGSVSPSSKVVTYGAAYGDLPTPTKRGYDFQGWHTTGDGGYGSYYLVTSSTIVSRTENHTLLAFWGAHTYTITLDPNGGTVSPTTCQIIYYHRYTNLPTPTRTGYTFDGWYTAASGGSKVSSGTTVSITAAQILYAHWTEHFSVTVPTNLYLAVNPDGVVYSPTTAAIINNGNDVVTVSAVTVQAANGWTVVPYAPHP